MIARKLFYLCEIAARLDSGMTLQVVHDYGGLARTGWRVALPVSVGGGEADWNSFSEFLRRQGEVEAIRLRGRWRGARIATVVLRALRHRSNVIVIRELRHLAAACAVRWLTGALLVSELHEGAFPRPDRRSRRRFAGFLAGLDGVVFTNASQRDYLGELGYALPRQQIVLPNGVDYDRFAAATPATGQAPFVLAYTGQFAAWKNFELLFAALSHLDHRFRLRIAGGKDNGESARQVGGLARRFGVEDRVEYLGFIHPAEIVSRAISGSAVLLLPLGDNTISRYATSPMKLIEYLATGIPVVAVGHPSVVALAGRDVVHSSNSDPEAFAAAIRAAVAEGGATRTQRGAKAKALAREFDHARRAARFDAWLSHLQPR